MFLFFDFTIYFSAFRIERFGRVKTLPYESVAMVGLTLMTLHSLLSTILPGNLRSLHSLLSTILPGNLRSLFQIDNLSSPEYNKF